MPLENLEGDSVFINALVATNPTGTDYPFPDGDNHIRGIKKVLKNTFPNFNSQITRSSEDIQRGSVPAGSVMVFYMVAAPVGWVRTQNITNTYALRIVPTASSGGSAGGTDDPVLNNKVPSHSHSVSAVVSGTQSANHTHTVSGTTGLQSADHYHAGTTDAQAPKTQDIVVRNVSPVGAYSGVVPGGNVLDPNNKATTEPHAHSFNTAGASNNHTHTFSATSAGDNGSHTHTVPAHNTNTNASAADWAPRYLDVILCVKS